mmetsp:Transcript_58101/g.124831  ORF Transcript_58101/g.124831 Transcript_58101/m.124831 type:complete len:261 (+) Transcript_58101:73-855(+)
MAALARSARLQRACEICTELCTNLVTPTSSCTHASTICKECFSKTVQMHVRDLGNIEEIPCPISGCDCMITHPDVQQRALRHVFKEYDELLMRRALQKMPNFVWCKAEGCGSGQLHEGGKENPVGVCNACKARFCFACDTPMHDGETCKRFQRRLREDTIDLLTRTTKACPNCGRRIEKMGGCDHMTCRKQVGGCGHEFCWRCLADYETILQKGNHHHHKTCQYYFAYDSGASGEEEEGAMECEDEGEEEEAEAEAEEEE